MTVVVNEIVEEQTCFHNVDIKDFIKNNMKTCANIHKDSFGQTCLNLVYGNTRKSMCV